jgi:hypothetical protein
LEHCSLWRSNDSYYYEKRNYHDNINERKVWTVGVYEDLTIHIIMKKRNFHVNLNERRVWTVGFYEDLTIHIIMEKRNFHVNLNERRVWTVGFYEDLTIHIILKNWNIFYPWFPFLMARRNWIHMQYLLLPNISRSWILTWIRMYFFNFLTIFGKLF